MDSLQAFAEAKLAALEAKSLKRTLVETRRLDGLWIERDGRRLLSFSCNDYLNLSHHPALKAAAVAAVEAHGTGAGASRLVTGDHPVVERLEARLAAFKNTKAACVFGSGYLANTGVIPTFVGPGDLVLVDELAHACIWAGAKLSGAEAAAFRHNDLAHLADLLATRRAGAGKVLVATDGVFSMDGDIAPLDQLSDLCAAHDAWLLSDDAHGVGVVGGGRGSAALFPTARIPFQIGTLSKALGGYGGYLCASKAVVDLVKTRARTFVYSTGMPPAVAASALAALDLIEADPALCAAPIAKARLFTRLAGLPEAQSAVVPVILGEADATLAASRRLAEAGFSVVAIRPPTVPVGTARLRIAFSAGHPDDEIARLAAEVVRLREAG
ncbi:8-amino-7-oxononanoate synthase [Caulobacter sp. CCUG 60055]|uniref:aminotransferase class I/II-fold pyridoxal phosphate-dependent enzyme n=1 Tax=Caulobacter sp. CCUG 60055 TaxID=2100090 RepID=UPI001FA7363E|nr:aminotransferase class I/II-fold pyridoxal phosphate-dependent enzyme [Caulobacter sp. CCUG 60055]MBQ1541272.1 aminotransferase class I/II-fold pyridoxal phosphate-dependent enzyme [Caulobacteraceae bacterium]MCI3182109.1 8-amino-7-oxononanoate synthase [Caulobacter sp. CCUG 60055]